MKHTRPYAPQSKPLEGLFALLEQLFFRHIEGWIGGDRMANKSTNLGKPPVPFCRPFAELQKLIRVAIDVYHVKPQGKKSALKGRSPAETFNAAVEAGWRPTRIDPVTLRIAFSEKVPRDNRGGMVQVARRSGGTEFWTCCELREHHKAKVYLLQTKFEDWRALPIFDYDDDRVLISLAETGGLSPGRIAGTRSGRCRASRGLGSVRCRRARASRATRLSSCATCGSRPR